MVLNYVYFGVSILGIFLFFFLLKKFFKWLQKKLDKLDRNVLFKKAEVVHFFKFITPRREKHILKFTIRALRIGISIVFLIFYLPFVFHFIPETQEIADTILSYVMSPVNMVVKGFLDFIPGFFFILVIFFGTKYLLKFLKYVTGELEKEAVRLDGFHADWAKPTFNLIRVVIIAFAVIICWPYIPGSQSEGFKGVSIFLGVLFSLGSTAAISNIVAGIVITYMRPFKVGDRVEIGNTIGDVTERSLLVTRLKTIKNLDVTIPNSSILGNHIVNFTKNAAEDVGVILHTSVTIGYDVPSGDVIQALVKGAKNTELILQKPEPFVLVKSLDDFYINYEINCHTKNPEKGALIYSYLHESIKNELHNAGIEILSPHYSAVRDGGALTVPPENVPKDYQQPGFKIGGFKIGS
ncbi:mechanosensitive ion channel family protein [Polaribacter dokdonensis]|uniref:Mechanosensitive ion channel n=1 Tax=Polaribacter dokdonensis DSW-5 TaxID=1300348 RepID=A0A0M9CEN5_9FLAO|nr:mechanosensitive ion channel family protein [Polaribacter dokdonensis]KOY50943.1 Small-conductance mechanosensitive channel [Polaribacter dokdonensis DSW-5]SEE22303.1 Mechanosensitive ion channel [Polaribacter dokdonensis DSW-5]